MQSYVSGIIKWIIIKYKKKYERESGVPQLVRIPTDFHKAVLRPGK